MKNSNYIVLLLLATLMVSCKNNKPLPDGAYRITGTVAGLTNGEFYLSNYPNPADTITIKDGKFEFQGKIDGSVKGIYLVKDLSERRMNLKTQLSLYVEPTTMTLKLNYNDFSKSKLTGSKTQDSRYQLDSIQAQIKQKYKPLLDKFTASRKEYQKAAAAGASEETLKALSYAENDIKDKLSPYYKESREANIKFVKEHPNSYISLTLLRSLTSRLKYEEAKEMYDKIPAEYTQTKMGKKIFKDIENLKKGVPGAPAGDFHTVDIHGDSIQLADFRGKYLIIDFWASWCVPCRKSNPHLIKLYKKYHPKGLEILGVSDDDSNPAAWRKAVKEDGIGIWHHVLRGAKMNKKTHRLTYGGIGSGYNIHFLPTKILVNPKGIVIARYVGGGEDVAAKIDKKMAEIFDN